MQISDLKQYTVVGGTGATPTPPAEKPKRTLGQKILDAGTSVSDFFGGKGVADTYGATFAKIGKSKEEKAIISEDQPTVKETTGSALQLGANFIPGVGPGAKLGTKVLVGAGTGLLFDVGSKMQNDQPIGPGAGTVVGAALPVGGAILRPVTAIVSRLFKGLGSGLSGVSTDTINKIIENPEVAQKASMKLATNGNYKVLEENAKTIMNGVSQIRKEASKAFGEGLDSLALEDINPQNIKENVFKTLEKHNISIGDEGLINVQGADFLDPKIQTRAESLITRINELKDLSGKGVRKVMDTIDNAQFKTAPDGDRQAFNAFASDLKSALRDAVSQSTPKLKEINAKYSHDLQLTDAIENIFGNVNFKNLEEVVKASQKLEGLFSQKGLAPKVVDDFLTRIGVKPADFKTSEAVRQISNKEAGANTKGLSIGEVTQQITSSVITPKMVKNLAIKTGLAEKQILPFLKKIGPSARNILIQAILKTGRGDSK